MTPPDPLLERLEAEARLWEPSPLTLLLREAIAAHAQQAEEIARLRADVEDAAAEAEAETFRQARLRVQLAAVQADLDEAHGIIEGLNDALAGRTRPLSDIRAALRERAP